MNTNINFAEHLYERLPEVYRQEDARAGVDFALRRYLEALDEGGIQQVFSELLALYDIQDVDKCPPQVLPLISRMLGYNYIEEVEIDTQRKIIANLIELYKRKGTKSVVNFITREFTQFDTKVIELQYRIFKTWSPNPKGIPKSDYVEPRTLGNKLTYNTCHLFSDTGMYNYRGIVVVCDAQASQIELLNRLLREFLPVYCNLYLKVNSEIQRYRETFKLNGEDTDVQLKVKEIEETVRAELKDSLKISYNTNENLDITTTENSKSNVNIVNEETPNIFSSDSLENKNVTTYYDSTPVCTTEELGSYKITIQDRYVPDMDITVDFKADKVTEIPQKEPGNTEGSTEEETEEEDTDIGTTDEKPNKE